MPVIIQPDSNDSGYYAPEELIRTFAGDSFDAEFNLRANEIVFDPDLLAKIQRMTDVMIDGLAYEVGLDPDASAPSPHYIGTDSPIFGSLQLWGSRWARSQGHLVRGESAGGDVDDDTEIGGTDTSGVGSIEGKMTRMRKEAEKRIQSLLKSYYERTKESIATRHSGIAVGRIHCHPAGYYRTRRAGLYFPWGW